MRPITVVRKILRQLGYDLRPLNRDARHLRTTIGESFRLLHHLGFRPRTIVDVGVGRGTMELYDAFPGARLLLIEPVADFLPDLESILKRWPGSYVLAAAGPAAGQATFFVHDHGLEGSSLFKESTGPHADGHQSRVPMVRIDDVVREMALKPPMMIKVDVQGAELQVLAGAEQTLAAAEAVALEVSLFRFFEGSPEFREVVEFMAQRDFVVFDVVLGANRPLDNALGQVDMVFVRKDGMFRRDHSYSAAPPKN